jgi:hypothetical protein
MTRRVFDVEAQARYTDDEFAALKSLANIADEGNCDAVMVAGDVFDSVQPRRSIVSRIVSSFTKQYAMHSDEIASLKKGSTNLDPRERYKWEDRRGAGDGLSGKTLY